MFEPQDYFLFYDILNNQVSYYNRYFTQTKHKRRLVIAPNDLYKSLQQKILDYFIEANPLKISEYSYAWVSGKNRVDCARLHVDKGCVIELDIASYFDNIRTHHLTKVFRANNIFNIFDIPIDEIIKFTTAPIHSGSTERFLAQGFKTSPYLANAVRYNIDMQISAYAIEKNLTYSAYGDNIILSGSEIRGDTIKVVRDILKADDFDLKPQKIKIMPYYKRQEVLGIVVNKKININNDYSKAVIGDIISKLKSGKELDAVIKGKLNILKSADNPRDYNYLLKLIERSKHSNISSTEYSNG